MSREKVNLPTQKRRVVWRITEAMPLGEFIDVGPDGTFVAPPLKPREPSHPGWATSSFELLNGVEITEEDPSTVPAELFDELFRKT